MFNEHIVIVEVSQCIKFNPTNAKRRKFRPLKKFYIRQHVTSVGILSQLHIHETHEKQRLYS
jgi:hypothetical protein